MKKANEIYGETEFWWCDYQPMLEQFGEILLQEDERGYQGDSYLIYEKEGKYGYLSFGWGSCSGCDALQACKTLNEVQELMDSLYNSIKWFDTLDALKEYFKTKDWSLEWEWHISEFRTFLSKVKEL